MRQIPLARERDGIGVYVMIRLRGGEFLYSDEDLAVMRDDILQVTQSGAEGVVLGLVLRAGSS